LLKRNTGVAERI